MRKCFFSTNMMGKLVTIWWTHVTWMLGYNQRHLIFDYMV